MMTHSNIGRTVRGYRLFRTVLSMGVLCIGLLGFNTSTMAAVTAKMTSPVANATAAEPGSFVLTATATSTGGTIKNVAFYSGTTLLNTDTTSPYTFTWNNVAAGTYVLKAKATDSKNATATSTTVTVTVTKVVKAYYIDVDHLNTPRAVTNSTGAAVWTWDNVDPYGANVPNENPGGLGAFAFNLRFLGQYFDRETSTHYNINRDYDPSIGRYEQSDPIGLDGGVNTYTYVEGDPLSYIDPDGLATFRFPGRLPSTKPPRWSPNKSGVGKPIYKSNPAHDPKSSKYNPKKTPEPENCPTVYKKSVPDDPYNPRHWWGQNDDGKFYRFSNTNDGTAHYSGTFDRRAPEVPPYVRSRLGY